MKSLSEQLVSVVIPVSNRIDELSRALGSVLLQDHHAIEVVVVENNSSCPEDIVGAVSDFEDVRVSVYHMSSCANANVARNFGASRCRGDYLAYLDSDDEWLPEHVSNCLESLHATGADFVYGCFVVDDGQGESTRSTRALEPGERAVDYLTTKTYGWAQTSTFFMRRRIIESVHWDEQLHRHQDLDFFCSVSQLFTLAVNDNPDVKVHWLQGEARRFHGPSLFLFYRKWKEGMTPKARWYYCLRRARQLYLHGDRAGAIRMAFKVTSILPLLLSR